MRNLPVEAELKEILSPAFRPDELLARCLGRTDLMKRILGKFRGTFVKDYDLLEAAVEQANAADVALLSHRLKGAAANIGAPAIRDVAVTIEDKARQQSLEGCRELLRVLANEWTRFLDAIDEHLQ